MWYYFVGVLETHTQHSVYAYALCKSLNTFHDGIIVVLYYCILFHYMDIYLFSNSIDGDHVLCSFKPYEHY